MSSVLMLWINTEDGKSLKTVQIRTSLNKNLVIANSQPDVNSNLMKHKL